MKVVLQRVSEASVDVVNELGTLDPTFEPQQIGPGFMILVGVTDEDGDKQIAWLVHKILNLRVFEDAQGKMNRSIQDIGGEILSISQFTLFADVHKGNRPSFIKAGKPEHADLMWIKFNEALRSGGVPVKEGRFGAHIRVGLVNDGPVTPKLICLTGPAEPSDKYIYEKPCADHSHRAFRISASGSRSQADRQALTAAFLPSMMALYPTPMTST